MTDQHQDEGDRPARPVPSPPYETVAALAAEVAKLRTLEAQVADVRADARFAKAAIDRAGLGLAVDMRAKIGRLTADLDALAAQVEQLAQDLADAVDTGQLRVQAPTWVGLSDDDRATQLGPAPGMGGRNPGAVLRPAGGHAAALLDAAHVCGVGAVHTGGRMEAGLPGTLPGPPGCPGLSRPLAARRPPPRPRGAQVLHGRTVRPAPQAIGPASSSTTRQARPHVGSAGRGGSDGHSWDLAPLGPGLKWPHLDGDRCPLPMTVGNDDGGLLYATGFRARCRVILNCRKERVAYSD